MEKEYKTKFERFKIEVNEIIKTHHPFGVFSKINIKQSEEAKNCEENNGARSFPDLDAQKKSKLN